MKTIKNYDDLPQGIKDRVAQALTEDILERYDNSSYHDEDIIHNTLQDNGYKLEDELNNEPIQEKDIRRDNNGDETEQ